MKRDDLLLLEQDLDEEIVRRRKLGGYDTNAETHLLALTAIRALVRHAVDQMPNPRVPLRDEKREEK